MEPVMAPASPARTNFIRRNLRGAASRRVGGVSPKVTEGVYGWILWKAADPSEGCLPLGEGGTGLSP
mgnify:CR=1 FL=1